MDFDENRKHFDACLFQKTKSLVIDNADVIFENPIFFGELVQVKMALVLGFVDQIMRYFDCTIGVEDGVLVFVNLAQQGTDLHMGFALVLQHLQSQRGLFWVAEVALHVFTV